MEVSSHALVLNRVDCIDYKIGVFTNLTQDHQDFNKNTILIEVGGQYNYIEEVNNTLKIMAKVIYEYLENEEEK